MKTFAALIFSRVLIYMTNNVIAADAAKKTFHATDKVEGVSFFVGHWRVHHEKFKKPLSAFEKWIEVVGVTFFFNGLDKIVRVEELHNANDAPFANAIRTFDIKCRGWLDAGVSLKKQRGK